MRLILTYFNNTLKNIDKQDLGAKITIPLKHTNTNRFKPQHTTIIKNCKIQIKK